MGVPLESPQSQRKSRILLEFLDLLAREFRNELQRKLTDNFINLKGSPSEGRQVFSLNNLQRRKLGKRQRLGFLSEVDTEASYMGVK